MSVYKRGGKYWIRFQHNGKEIRKPAHTANKRQAEEFEHELREQYSRIRRGGKPRYTYGQAVEKFMEEHLPSLKPSSQKRYLVSLLALDKHFNGLYLDEINKARLADFESYRKREKVTGTGIRRDLACLSSMLTNAVKWDWLESNVVKSFDKRSIKEQPPRTRYLSREEFALLVGAAKKPLRELITFAVEVGLRKEEQFSLEWSQVDIKKHEVTITKTKSGSPRVVPLSGEALAQLSAQVRHLHSPYVFCKKDGTRYSELGGNLRRVAASVGITNLRWHDLRRTCGSWLLQDGVDIYTVKKWLGHKNVSVTERSYAFLRTDDLHEAAKLRTKTGTASRDS